MGDISELRGLVVAGTFITITILLISFIPSEFYVSSETMQQITAPTYFEAIDMQIFVDTYNFTLTNTTANTGYVDLGGWRFSQFWSFGASEPTRATFIARYDSFLIFNWFVEFGDFNRKNIEIGTPLPITRLDSDYASDGIEGMEYIVKFGTNTQFYIFFAFNETTYSTPQDAWEQSDLHVLWGMNFDQANTGYSAWDLIAMLLFFNLPTVHFLINALLAVPLWIAIVYLSYILMLRAIGAVFGGGA